MSRATLERLGVELPEAAEAVERPEEALRAEAGGDARDALERAARQMHRHAEQRERAAHPPGGASEPAHVVVADLNEEGAQATAAQISVNADRKVLAVKVDVTDENVDEVLTRLRETYATVTDVEDKEYQAKEGDYAIVDVVSEDSDRFKTVVTPALQHVDYLIVNEIEAGKIAGFGFVPTAPPAKPPRPGRLRPSCAPGRPWSSASTDSARTRSTPTGSTSAAPGRRPSGRATSARRGSTWTRRSTSGRPRSSSASAC